jgi:hypothetical protein
VLLGRGAGAGAAAHPLGGQPDWASGLLAWLKFRVESIGIADAHVGSLMAARGGGGCRSLGSPAWIGLEWLQLYRMVDISSAERRLHGTGGFLAVQVACMAGSKQCRLQEVLAQAGAGPG